MKRELESFEVITQYMMFCNNYTIAQLEAMFESTNCPIHLYNKWRNMEGRGTDKLIKLWLELSNNNRKSIADYIMNLKQS